MLLFEFQAGFRCFGFKHGKVQEGRSMEEDKPEDNPSVAWPFLGVGEAGMGV